MENPSIPDDEVLYRRVMASWIVEGRLASVAFVSSHVDGCSTLSGAHCAPEDCLVAHPHMGLAAITASDVRAVGGNLRRDPEDPAHVLIQLNGKKPARELAKRATLLVLPPSGLSHPEPAPEKSAPAQSRDLSWNRPADERDPPEKSLAAGFSGHFEILELAA